MVDPCSSQCADHLDEPRRQTSQCGASIRPETARRLHGGQGKPRCLPCALSCFLKTRLPVSASAAASAKPRVPVQIKLESQAGLGTTVHLSIDPQSPALGSGTPCPLELSPKLTQMLLSEDAAPMLASWQPPEHLTSVLAGKRVVVLDSSKFLVRGLTKHSQKVEAMFARLLSV